MKLMEFVINMAVNGNAASKDLKAVANNANAAGKSMSDLEKRAEAAGSRIGDSMKKAASSLGDIAKRAAYAGAAAASGLGFVMIKQAAATESLKVSLTTIEGSSERAEKSLSWVKEFAKTTPYELAEVSDAFKTLKSYGLDPIADNLLTDVGNMASAMGKPLSQATEAISDAMTGEFERLKEFGIKASKENGTVTLKYVKNGVAMTKVVKENAAEIQKAFQDISREKFTGGMEAQSKTMAGVFSNLKDSFSAFVQKIADSGAFERVKQLLLQMTEWVANNQEKIDEYAQKAGDFIVRFVDGFVAALPQIIKVASAFGTIVIAIAKVLDLVAQAIGGWDNLTYALIGVKTLAASGLLSPLMSAIPMLMSAVGGLASFVISSFLRMGAVMLANPIGLVVAAIVAGAYLVWRNWDKIIGLLKNAWLGAKLFLSGIADGIMAIWANIANYVIDKVNTVVGAINMVSGANIGTFDRVGGAAPSTANPATSSSGGNTFTNNVTVNANTRAAVDRAVEPSFGRQTRSAGLSGVMA